MKLSTLIENTEITTLISKLKSIGVELKPEKHGSKTMWAFEFVKNWGEIDETIVSYSWIEGGSSKDWTVSIERQHPRYNKFSPLPIEKVFSHAKKWKKKLGL